MKLLLDTHTFIWWDSEPARLSEHVRELCADPANTLILSVTSLWEMQIKQQLGKLSLRIALTEIVSEQVATNGIVLLPIFETHIFALEQLPTPHKDPFDRLLVAQAIVEGATLVSIDTVFRAYPVSVVW